MFTKLKFPTLFVYAIALSIAVNGNVTFAKDHDKSMSNPTEFDDDDLAQFDEKYNKNINNNKSDNQSDSNKYDNTELNEIFRNSHNRIDAQTDKLIDIINTKYSDTVNNYVSSNQTSEQTADFQAQAGNYIGKVVKTLSIIPTHLRTKMEELNARIAEDNNATEIRIANSFTKHVEDKSGVFQEHIGTNFSIEKITGNDEIDKAVHEALGGNYKQTNSTDSSNKNIEEMIKVYVMEGSPYKPQQK